jgi:hypothetical protein
MARIEIFGLQRNEDVENYIMRSFISCTLHLILLRGLNQGEGDEWGLVV